MCGSGKLQEPKNEHGCGAQHVTTRHPLGDRRLIDALGRAQILNPAVGHLLQQPCADGLISQDQELPGRGVMRRGGGDGRLDP